MPLNDYFVYVAKVFETPQSVANHFGITIQQLFAANPQWKNRIVIIFKPGEEVIMPDIIASSLMFSIFKFELIVKERKATDLNQPKIYAADWFPPKPDFGSPSKPMSALLAKLGNPKYTVDKPGTRHSPITFADGWAAKNISSVEIPQFKDVPFYSIGNKIKCKGKISFYTKAHKAVQELFNAWEKDGLIPKILTFEGSFNARVIKSTLTASNHSFGTAFDINGSWNVEGSAPAGIGKAGYLLELVPRASELGFYWGGFYEDGMDFEYAKL